MSDARQSVVERLDAADGATVRAALARCAGPRAYVEGMVARRPFQSWAALVRESDSVWQTLGRQDVLEATAHHPPIGSDREALRARFAATAAWSEAEQRGASGASDEVLERLAKANAQYAERFGYTFIVCATGKTAAEMLALLCARLGNDPELEWTVAREELRKITLLRLEKLEHL